MFALFYLIQNNKPFNLFVKSTFIFIFHFSQEKPNHKNEKEEDVQDKEEEVEEEEEKDEPVNEEIIM